MKNFIELFTDARAVSTPLIAVRTFDPASTIQNVTKSLGDESQELPIVSWDSIHGLRGLNTKGAEAIGKLCSAAQVEQAALVDLPLALGVLEVANSSDSDSGVSDVIAFVHNPQLVWNEDKKIIQAIWNLRDGNKANGNMLVVLYGVGDTLPVELQSDMLALEEPLPTREELAKIVIDTFEYAAAATKIVNGKKVFPYAKCKGAATPEVVAAAVDALVGLPAFPADQATAMCLDKVNGKLDIKQLWERKKTIVSQKPGLSYHNGSETLKDMYGVEAFANFGMQLMKGKHSPTLILRADEIEKQFAGNQSDTSGVKGDMLGEFLTWVQDNNVICSLLLGVPGSSKSWSVYCIAGEFNKPVINYSISAMQDSHVGTSGKNLRNANKTLEAISDKRIWLVATANSLRGLPPELISRFQVGGIFFFDAPDKEERDGIMKLKLEKYGLDASQEIPDMTGWTGRDIENCARKADILECSVVDAGQYVVPLMKSHAEQMNELRQSAAGRFLSASKPGVYEYTAIDNVAVPTTHGPKVTISEGRKMR